MDRNGSDVVQVPIWAVLMAVRYGLSRQSYNHADALDLIRTYHERMPRPWVKQLGDELYKLAHDHRGFLTEREREHMIDLANEIDPPTLVEP